MNSCIINISKKRKRTANGDIIMNCQFLNQKKEYTSLEKSAGVDKRDELDKVTKTSVARDKYAKAAYELYQRAFRKDSNTFRKFSHFRDPNTGEIVPLAKATIKKADENTQSYLNKYEKAYQKFLDYGETYYRAKDEFAKTPLGKLEEGKKLIKQGMEFVGRYLR